MRGHLSVIFSLTASIKDSVAWLVSLLRRAVVRHRARLGPDEPAGSEPPVDVRHVRVLLAACAAPSYLYYSMVVERNPFSLFTPACALALIVSQYISDGSRNGFLTPVAGCLLNASVICTTGFQRSPFIFLTLIPLLTYSIERDAVWVLRSVMLNSIVMVFLLGRSLVQADWFAVLNVLGFAGISHTACYYIRQSKSRLASIVTSRTQESHVDPLTGLYNRRALAKEISGLMAASRPFALVVCDIDGFKWYNDTYGHLEGDKVLQAIAHILIHLVTPQGMVFRWGGDEFVLVLPAADRLTAESIGTNISNLI